MKHLFKNSVLTLAMAVLLSACGTNGTDGTNGTNGTNGAAAGVKLSDEPAGANCPYGGTKVEVGPDANNDGLPDTVTSTNYTCNAGDVTAASDTVTATIDNVNVVLGSGSVTMIINFTVKNGAGNEIVGLGDADSLDSTKMGHLAFNIAKLLPGTNGDTNTWWNIASEGKLANLTNKGGGHYTYTTGAITTSGSITSAKYDNTQLTRVVLRVMPNNSRWVTWEYGHLDALGTGANAYYDIKNGSTVSKDVVRTANCLECHSKFGGKSSFHQGEGNVTTEACAVCHLSTMGTPAGDGEFGRLAHKIHAAQVADGHDFTGVTYPQDIRNCTKCHKGGADSDNWKTKPTIASCGSCHSTVDFSSGLNHSAQADNSACANCHNPNDIAAYHVAVVGPDPNNIYGGGSNANTNAAYLAATGVVPTGADRITYVVKSVSTVDDLLISPSKRPSITFKLQKNGVDVVFDSPPPSATELMPDFVGSPSVYFAWAVPQDGIATPADFNATASGYIKNIWNGTAFGAGGGTMTGPDGEGYYTITLAGVAVPLNAVMLTGGVGYNYNLSTTQPLTQVNVPAYPYNGATMAGGLIVPAPNVWKVATGYAGRRVIVDTAKCNTCHDGLGVAPTFHVGQRNDAPTCSFCHTPNRTSNGWSANGSTLVHAIHGASKRTVPFTWNAASAGQDYSLVSYPGVPNNCEQCHVPGGYDYSGSMYTGAQTVSNMLLTTCATGKYNSDPSVNFLFFRLSPYVIADNTYDYGSGFSYNAATGVTTQAADRTLVESPVTAVCISCHDSSVVRDHITANGGSFYVARSTALLRTEPCLMCHGPGKVAAIKEVHSR